ncbi:MAG: hypothetical protein A3C85_02975 [Candidatus Doudnabacteria bacterium RIFCSPHIGHO2_02_FULL_48_21]|uniref:Uncharacterized protein n=1 Tax=Candidatus Doudnabacteria bacterium RIFCSPLOWO2_02_FULL_48_13 TaxID=1817845 RepID=A0A1F5QBZ9_9BACT|nr:MAG: hypothetical protein A3K05_00235 [Candidatus Doudnabacteria bacterium RIFCSPHIGHO2_01_48_18]OGE79455.1 MAG: hypothetical protein A2668_02070 [Candidatus Doudnabacteria bacterium RIFCSPHIGHO2_01_FULL_48_180]OGE91612.1 MAG: hypothetical protein A3F44_02805 [Candidatus Doudnabacteria bacterium RIFCSPHIGHO2_12_FULL_47_25]OGE93227.1 MAG: hypothetical protein A3C85_02975 [Candidatus Doudnabacteria bacterium RIFCSPHIGHO2_02_FULL_48_21]OGE97916.1 MAG: hypothetical protein A3A83_03125 [Candidatu
MNNFNLTKALGFGVVIWFTMFALVSAMVGFNLFDSVLSQITVGIIGGIVAYGFASNARSPSQLQSFAYGGTWLAIGVILDAIVTSRFETGLFGSWTYWLGYGLILFAPWLQLELRTGEHHQPVI